MTETDAPEIEIETPPPGLKALFVQLGDDAKSFARAEADWLKAEAGERAGIAKPAIAAILVGVALLFGAVMAVPVGIMLILAPIIGAGWAMLASIGLFAAIAGLLFLFASQRLKRAFQPRSQL